MPSYGMASHSCSASGQSEKTNDISTSNPVTGVTFVDLWPNSEYETPERAKVSSGRSLIVLFVTTGYRLKEY